MNKGATSDNRKLIIMRHAERVDFTFGSWIPSTFDDKGNYIRRNLNMPLSLPERSGGPKDFLKDSPLTRVGLFQATLTGEAMKLSGVKFDHVFCSPSLRCVETCTNVLKASNQTHLKIQIEPGLFEWCGWYKNSMPVFMSLEELSKSGYNVAMDYKPIISVMALDTSESCEMYYMRSFLVAKKALESCPGDILIVGHAGTLDSCSRQLIGKPERPVIELLALVQRIPYCSVCIVEKESEESWKIVDPPFPPLKHCDNLGFDWHIIS